MSTAPNFRAIATPLDVADQDLAAINQRLGVPTLVTSPRPKAPMKPMNLLLPAYLVKAIKDRAHADDTSHRYVVLKALHDAGFPVEPDDLVKDARRAE